MMLLFRSVHESTDVTIVMVTHAVALMSRGTRVVEMTSGHIPGEVSHGMHA